MLRIISVALLLCTGCTISGAKVSVSHTEWNDGYNPTTISIETDVQFDKRNNFNKYVSPSKIKIIGNRAENAKLN